MEARRDKRCSPGHDHPPERTVSRTFVAALMLAFAAPAPAAQRTFVASFGNDANPCSLAAPCRSFQAAVAAVGAGGEVVALDSAGYGSVVVDKSVSLIAPPGVHAAITAAPSGNGITVNAGGGDVIVLRGLAISGPTAVDAQSADDLYVDRCVTKADVGLTVGSSVNRVFVTDTVFDRNVTGVFWDGGPESRLYVARSRFLQGAFGVRVHQGTLFLDHDAFEQVNGIAGLLAQTNFDAEAISADVRDSTFVGGIAPILVRALQANASVAMTVDRSTMARGQDGIRIEAQNGGTATVAITRSSAIQNSAAGVVSFGSGSAVSVSDTAANRNDVGLAQAGGATLVSFGNNSLAANKTAPTSGTIGGDILR
jgi:hypothetical protein